MRIGIVVIASVVVAAVAVVLRVRGGSTPMTAAAALDVADRVFESDDPIRRA